MNFDFEISRINCVSTCMQPVPDKDQVPLGAKFDVSLLYFACSNDYSVDH